jgi:P27 family predicted phage terminase small subunit
MGRPGPAPKPAGLRLLEGTDRRGRSGRILDRTREPVAPSGVLEPPYELSAEAAEIWAQTVRDLEAMGLDSPADAWQLASYVEAAVTFGRASRELAQTPLLAKGSRSTVANKLLAVQHQARMDLLRLAQEFGLTPAARMRVEADPYRGGGGLGAKKPNPFAG